jgi:hypothetical protein
MLNYTPAELAAVKKLQGLPDDQFQNQLLNMVSGGMSFARLLSLKREADRISQQQQAQQAILQAQKAGQAGGLADMQAQIPTVKDELEEKVANSGVAALPVNNFQPENFAGGGIVAFAKGDVVEGGASTEEVLKQLNADKYNAFQPKYSDQGLGAVAPTAAPPAASAGPKSFLSAPMQGLENSLMGYINQTMSETVPERSLESITTERQNLKKAAYKDEGLTSYADRIAEYKNQAIQAREERDTDRLLSLAQGFFAMGAAKSPYALQNMSEGFGVAAGQLRVAEKAYRDSERDRMKSISALEDARRKELDGDLDGAEKAYEKHLELRTRSADRKTQMAGALLGRIGSSEIAASQRAAAAETAAAAKYGVDESRKEMQTQRLEAAAEKARLDREARERQVAETNRMRLGNTIAHYEKNDARQEQLAMMGMKASAQQRILANPDASEDQIKKAKEALDKFNVAAETLRTAINSDAVRKARAAAAAEGVTLPDETSTRFAPAAPTAAAPAGAGSLTQGPNGVLNYVPRTR